MAEQKAKGSIIYELLIVILGVMLVGSILYPKRVTDREKMNTEICRYRMGELEKAGLQFHKYHGTYTDTLSQVFDFIRTSAQYERFVDSLIVSGVDSVITRLNDFKTREETILSNIPLATDSVMIDSLAQMQDDIKFDARSLAGYVEFLHDRMKNLPNMPVDQLRAGFLVVDSKQFTLDMDITKNSIQNGLLREAERAAKAAIRVVNRVGERFERVLARVPDYRGASLDSLARCPTVYEQYELVHVDTSVIKYLNIYCPIDSADIAAVNNDFLKSKIGGLELQNHGKIESGEKSWEADQ